MGLPAAARVRGDTSGLENAKALCHAAIASPSALPYRVTLARLGLAFLAIQQGDVAAAREQYAALESVPGIMLLYVSTDRTMGLLAHTMGDLDLSAGHFQDGLDFCRKAGYRPELAWTCSDYADALVQRDDSGDRSKAVSLLEEALVIARELGMQPLLERVVAHQGRIELPSDQARQFPDGLSQREVEVLLLIASGSSNREIAAKLILSIRTVERHITNIYGKISARGRADATSYVVGHELLRM